MKSGGPSKNSLVGVYPSKRRTRREQEPVRDRKMLQHPAVRQTDHQLNISVQKSLKNRNWSKPGLGGYVHFNIPVGYRPSNNPLVDVLVQKTHKNRNWLETESRSSVRPAVYQTIHWLLFPSKKLTIYTVQQFEIIVFFSFFALQISVFFSIKSEFSHNNNNNNIIIIILKFLYIYTGK